ncbi:hypothetical protein [Cohaesibacter haloalkalitolerans]|uniref:hypothetical protein n=1 Tax=Cohaesibacter haloalkalitolerans TaxID=1162980 RepID=UPI000E648F2E|nr:hypothetical protein [Cohaesibacter haloalkalitolerans]
MSFDTQIITFIAKMNDGILRFTGDILVSLIEKSKGAEYVESFPNLEPPTPITDWQKTPKFPAFLEITGRPFYKQFSSAEELLDWLEGFSNRTASLKSLTDDGQWGQLVDHAANFINKARLELKQNSGTEGCRSLAQIIKDNGIILPDTLVGNYVFDQRIPAIKRLITVANLSRIDFSKASQHGGWPHSPIDTIEVAKSALREKLTKVSGSEISTLIGQVTVELASNDFDRNEANIYYNADLAEARIAAITAIQRAENKLKLRPANQSWQTNARNNAFMALIGLSPFIIIPIMLLWNWGSIGEFLTGLTQSPLDKVVTASDQLWKLSNITGAPKELAPQIEQAERTLRETKDALLLLSKSDSSKEIFATPLQHYAMMLKDAPWTSLVFVTVPALFFMWILKHFSRIFVQSFNIRNDANYRAALSEIYSYIDTDNKLTADQKRIVFEAMFKPRNVTHNDDGVPISVLESAVSAATQAAKRSS